LLPLVGLLLGLTSPLHAVAGAHQGGERKPVIVPAEEQEQLIEFMNAFIADMDAKYFGRVEDLNGGIEFEDRTFENEYSSHQLRVARGEVMEKAGRMNSFGKKQHPMRGDQVLKWSRFYALDMHPKTPLVGMLHATIVMQVFEDGTVGTGGFLGVMPGTKIDVDLTLLKKITDDYFAAHDRDPTLYRKLICKGTEDTVTEFRRKPACSGVSFYGPPVYRTDPGASIKFIAGLYDEFVGAYMDITELRAPQPFSETDIIAQDEMRRRWLIDQLFSDPFASKIVPFEVWSFANNPPIIKF
jgi:coproporphyrinogen III oxidase